LFNYKFDLKIEIKLKTETNFHSKISKAKLYLYSKKTKVKLYSDKFKSKLNLKFFRNSLIKVFKSKGHVIRDKEM
jgi:hypothetical protein